MRATADTALIGVDWGTTQLRAYRLDPAGQVVDRRESASGIASVRNAEFNAALSSLIRDWRSPHPTPILMCGMIGSRQGWREAPYCSCPARLHDLTAALCTVETDTGPAFIVPGLKTTTGNRRHDVIRGEETQIFGVAPATGEKLVVTPGTHSKWAVLRDGAIESFRTYMTGEIYAILRQHSVLGWLMREDRKSDEDQAPDVEETAFLEGVHESIAEPDLLHSLFGVRTRGLFEPASASALASYLSGLLIGSEVAGAARQHRADGVVVIASPSLGRLYHRALSVAGFTDIQCVDGDKAVAQGLWRVWQLRKTKGDA